MINDDDDDNPCSSPGAAPHPLLPAPHASYASVSHHHVPLWLPASIPLPAPDSRGLAKVRGVVLRGHWAEQEGRGPRLPCRFCIKKWKADSLVVCEEDLRRPNHCTEYRDGRWGCILVGLLLVAFSLDCQC